MISDKLTIFWFRRDLRLDDNAGLYYALQSKYPVLPVFIFDTNILDNLNEKKDRRIWFIYNTLLDMHNNLTKAGSSLLLLQGNPILVFRELIGKYNIDAVYTNNDYEPYAIDRDRNIANLLKENNIGFRFFKDQVVFEKSEIVKPDGAAYTIYTPYSKAWKKKLLESTINIFQVEPLFNRFYKITPFPFPDIEDIGFTKFPELFYKPKVNEDVILNYHETRNFPYLDGTSNLSVHLRFGTISIRQLVILAQQLNEYWLNELIWREFFKMILYHFPQVKDTCFKRKYENIDWQNNEMEFEKWCRGETGYPIVDAGMRELNETGLMHNRVRMVVASFLTKHLLIDWKWGEAYFAEKLLDYDMSSNNGNWQWAASCGCDAVPYFRIFNPIEQARKFDPDQIYIRKWVKNLDDADYSMLIVDHKLARERALKVYKKALFS